MAQPNLFGDTVFHLVFMMFTTSLSVLLSCVAAGLVLFRITVNFLVCRRNAATVRALKCEEPPFERNRWPLGIDNLVRSLTADRDQRFPEDLIERFEALNTNTYRYEILGSRNIRTADPKNIQAILATQFADFDLGPNRRGAFLPLLGHGIFTADGDEWKHSRAMIRPQFTRDQVSDLDLEERHVQNMMSRLEPLVGADGWTTGIDLQPYFFRLTMDSATEFLFGESVNSQLQHLPGRHPASKIGSLEARFATAFDAGQRCLATRGRFLDKHWIYNTREFRDSCRIVHEFVDHFVHLALSKAKKSSADNDDTDDAPEKGKYIFLDALAAHTQDPTELRSELLHILLAARDTTASHLGWIFHNLATHPSTYASLRASILAHFGPYPSPLPITFSSLKACAPLQHVAAEALRLFPPVPFNSRYANKDTTLPRGGGEDGMAPVFVPKGSSVDYSVHVMQRSTGVWGEDAAEWRPERWAEGEGKGSGGWGYLPFNGGPRVCVGQQFALTEACYVTVRLVQRFDGIESLMAEGEKVRHNLTLINTIANGVKVRLHAADV